MFRSHSGPLAPILALAFLAVPVAAQQDQDFSKVQIKSTHVAGSVYMLEGAGGNIAASVGEDGIVIVDDQFAPLAEKIRASLKALSISDKPVRFVINTHYHFDHTGGNAPFSGTSTVLAHDNVRKRLVAGGPAGNGGSMHFDTKPAEKAALPVITFADDLTIHVNGEEVRALHVEDAHTDGDVIVFFPRAGVVHMGDAFVRYGFPFIDVVAGGSWRGMIEANRKVLREVPAGTKVIPGHGGLATLDDVREFVKMLEETGAAVERAMKAGQTLEQMKEAKILEPWQRWSGDFISADAFIETLHASFGGGPAPGFRQHN